MKRNRISHLMRYKPEPGRSELFPPVTSAVRPERDPWTTAGQIVGSGLCLAAAATGILAMIYLIGYVGALGVVAGLGL